MRTVPALALLFLAGCWGAKEAEWRQKLTLHLSTPEGAMETASVTSIRCEAGYALDIGGTKVICRETGEAIVAELGGRYLFVLLDGVQLGYRGAFRALLEEGDDYRAYWKRIARSEGQRFDVPRDLYPLFVSFEDINDPASVFEVDPDNLTQVFGAGYAVEKLILGGTGEAQSVGAITKVLGWLSGHQGRIKPTDTKAAKDLLSEEKIYGQDFVRSAK